MVSAMTRVLLARYGALPRLRPHDCDLSLPFPSLKMQSVRCFLSLYLLLFPPPPYTNLTQPISHPTNPLENAKLREKQI